MHLLLILLPILVQSNQSLVIQPPGKYKVLVFEKQQITAGGEESKKGDYFVNWKRGGESIRMLRKSALDRPSDIFQKYAIFDTDDYGIIQNSESLLIPDLKSDQKLEMHVFPVYEKAELIPFTCYYEKKKMRLNMPSCLRLNSANLSPVLEQAVFEVNNDIENEGTKNIIYYHGEWTSLEEEETSDGRNREGDKYIQELLIGDQLLNKAQIFFANAYVFSKMYSECWRHNFDNLAGFVSKFGFNLIKRFVKTKDKNGKMIGTCVEHSANYYVGEAGKGAIGHDGVNFFKKYYNEWKRGSCFAKEKFKEMGNYVRTGCHMGSDKFSVLDMDLAFFKEINANSRDIQAALLCEKMQTKQRLIRSAKMKCEESGNFSTLIMEADRLWTDEEQEIVLKILSVSNPLADTELFRDCVQTIVSVIADHVNKGKIFKYRKKFMSRGNEIFVGNFDIRKEIMEEADEEGEHEEHHYHDRIALITFLARFQYVNNQAGAAYNRCIDQLRDICKDEIGIRSLTKGSAKFSIEKLLGKCTFSLSATVDFENCKIKQQFYESVNLIATGKFEEGKEINELMQINWYLEVGIMEEMKESLRGIFVSKIDEIINKGYSKNDKTSSFHEMDVFDVINEFMGIGDREESNWKEQLNKIIKLKVDSILAAAESNDGDRNGMDESQQRFAEDYCQKYVRAIPRVRHKLNQILANNRPQE